MFLSFKGSAKLKAEIDSWVEEGIINSEQANQLRIKYELDAAPPWYRRTDFILKGVAILFLVMALFLLISSNWDELPIPIRMLTGLLPLFITYGFIIKNVVDDEADNIELLSFLACLLLGANIYLQAQIFHISSYFPNGILWWILGSLPFAVYLRSTIISIGLHGLFISWLSMQNQYEQFSFWGIIIFASLTFILYHKPNRIVVIIYAVTLVTFLTNIIDAAESIHSGFWNIEEFQTFILASGLLYLSLFNLVSDKYSEAFSERLQRFISTGFIAIFYMYTFQDLIENMTGNHIFYTSTIVFVIAIVLMALQKSKINFEIITTYAITLMIFAFNLFSNSLELDKYSRMNESTSFILAIIINLLFFGYCITKIYIGIRYKVKRHFFWGILYLIGLALTRYVHYFENYLVTSIIFAGCAAFIYFINKYWNEKLERA